MRRPEGSDARHVSLPSLKTCFKSLSRARPPNHRSESYLYKNHLLYFFGSASVRIFRQAYRRPRPDAGACTSSPHMHLHPAPTHAARLQVGSPRSHPFTAHAHARGQHLQQVTVASGYTSIEKRGRAHGGCPVGAGRRKRRRHRGEGEAAKRLRYNTRSTFETSGCNTLQHTS
jgi:hypothetical protein